MLGVITVLKESDTEVTQNYQHKMYCFFPIIHTIGCMIVWSNHIDFHACTCTCEYACKYKLKCIYNVHVLLFIKCTCIYIEVLSFQVVFVCLLWNEQGEDSD